MHLSILNDLQDPLLYVIEGSAGNRGDHGGFESVILEDEDHVEALDREPDAFKHDEFHLFKGYNEGRPFTKADETAARRHHEDR